MARTFRLMPGSTFLERYQVVKLLGKGAMGAVYLVEDAGAGGVRRALKLMNPNVLDDDPKAIRRFEREVQAAGRIASEYVVPVYAAGVDPKTKLPWLAMEYVEGQPLDGFVTDHPELTRSQRRLLVEQLFHGCSAAHQVGVVHRDLKPENMFVAQSAQQPGRLTLKLLDFGIAKLVADTGTTMTAAGLGTPLWTAPEQGKAGAHIRPTADVWALGLLTFFLTTGNIYWFHYNQPKSSPFDVAMEMLRGELATASARAAQLGCAANLLPQFDPWFTQCVNRDPAARFSDAPTAFASLQPLLEAWSGAAP